jgi:5-methylcytosine-specific restriction enzyme subunit McrC
LNRIFRFVVEALLLQTIDHKNRSLLLDLRDWLAPAHRLPSVSKHQLDGTQFTRLNNRYIPAFNLARLFIEGSILQLAGGGHQTFAFVFDMNVLFEAFVAGFISRYKHLILPAGWEGVSILVKAKGQAYYLAERHPGGVPVFLLQPDILFTRPSGSPLLILDTKYKRLDEEARKRGMAESDLYQMLAYQVRMSCRRALVVYPQSSGMMPIRERFKIIGNSGEVNIATIDLHQPLATPDRMVQEFKALFTSYSEAEETGS